MAATQTQSTATVPAAAAAAVSSVASAAVSAGISTAEADVKADVSKVKAEAVTESETHPWVFAAIAFVLGASAALEAVHYLHLAL